MPLLVCIVHAFSGCGHHVNLRPTAMQCHRNKTSVVHLQPLISKTITAPTNRTYCTRPRPRSNAFVIISISTPTSETATTTTTIFNFSYHWFSHGPSTHPRRQGWQGHERYPGLGVHQDGRILCTLGPPRCPPPREGVAASQRLMAQR